MNIPEDLKVFSYGTSLNNLPDWGKWEIMCEIISNAKDAAGENYIVSRSGEDVAIVDQGNGLSVKNLIIGETDKKGKNNQIGQFGEGLKQAMLVMTRLNKKVQIWSGSLYIENYSYIPDGFDTQVFAVKYGYNKENYSGTTVILHDWGENEDTFEGKFLSDDMILIKNSDDMAILDNAQLFNKGVFIKDLPNFELGYNIVTTSVNRDRNVVDDYTLKYYLGKIWSQIQDENTWELFFLACKESRSEREIGLHSYSMTNEVKTAMKKAFQKIFGSNAYIRTTDDNAREAEHRGAKLVESAIFGHDVLKVLSENIGTDRSFVMEKMGKKAFVFPESKLNSEQRKNLSLIRKIMTKMDWSTQIIIAELESNLGEADCANNIIRLQPAVLVDRAECLDIFIHEIAHILENSRDNKDEMVNAVTKTAAKLLVNLVGFLKEE